MSLEECQTKSFGMNLLLHSWERWHVPSRPSCSPWDLSSRSESHLVSVMIACES